MADVWDKLDRYTKSDYLNSSDDENQEVYFEQTEHLYISTKKFHQTEVDEESLCSEDVDNLEDLTELTQNQQEIKENLEKQETNDNTYETLLDEMKKSELHCNSETRNVQEKIDKISSEKSQQKDELNEMQHKAQVISTSARMSATDVLSAITSSETMNHEDSGELDEFYDRIRSKNTDENTPKDYPDSERKSSSGTSSDVDLPSIAPLSMPLNTGVMKSKANVARQGSMKTRRKPTAVKRKSWTPGMDEYNLREQDEEETVEDVEQNEQGDIWVTTQARSEDNQTGSYTPSDSSSEDEKEVVKPHMRSAIAMPGLGDALKIQLTRSELKRPTALSLAKTAKDAKVNEITKEDKVETSPSKPDWMEEVEKRKKQARSIPQRRHKTLPERSSELDALFEQRKQGQSSEAVDPRGQEASRPKSFPGEDCDPELQKIFEKRKNLTPLEGEDGTVKDVERPRSFHENKIDPELSKMFEKRKNLSPLVSEGETERPKSFHENKIDPELSRMFEKRKNFAPLAGERDFERPKSFHGDKIDPELSRMFEKRNNLKPFEVDDGASDEGSVAKETQRPKSYHGDELDSELNKMFQRRKNLKPVESTSSGNRDEEDQTFKPRNIHLQNSEATELDKIFEKRKQLRPVGEARSYTPQSATGEFSTSVVNSSSELRQTSGIVRARFHDTKLEPLPSRGEILKVATVSAAEVKTARQVTERRRMSPEEREVGRGGTRLPTSGQSGPSKPPRTPDSGAQIAEFTFDGRGASQATVGRIPIGESGPPKPPRAPTSGAQVAEFTFDGRGAMQATVGRIPIPSGPPKPHRTMSPHAPTTPERGRTGGDQTAEFGSDDVGGMQANVGQVSGSGGDRRGIFNPIGQQLRTSPQEENSGQEASGAQVAQFVFDGSAAASRATVVRIPVGGGQEQTSLSKGDSRSDDTARGDHVIRARSRVIESRDAITKKSVVSPKSSETRDFIAQLSRKPVPGKSLSQGKFVSQPCVLDNKQEREPPHPSSAGGRRELYTDREYNTAHHNDRHHFPREGSIPSPQYMPPHEELPSRNLPPISTHYTTPPSQNSNLTQLSRSVSHPPNSQFPNHPPLHAKTSDPQHLYTPHSPRGCKEGRPRPVRIREVRDTVREINPEPNRVSHERPPAPNISRDVNGYVGVGNGESYGDGNRFSDSVAPRSNRRYDAKLDERPRRGRSRERSDHKVIRGTQNSEGLEDKIICRVQSSDKSTDERLNGGDYGQRANRVLSPDRSNNQRRDRVLSPDRSNDQRRDRVLSPDWSNNQRRDRALSPDRSNNQRRDRVLSPDRSNDQRRDRVLSPDRSNDQRRDRVLSPDRSNNQRRDRVLSPDRSNNQRRNRFRSSDGSYDDEMNNVPHNSRNPIKNENGRRTEDQILVRRRSDRSSDDRIKNRDRSGDEGIKSRDRSSDDRIKSRDRSGDEGIKSRDRSCDDRIRSSDRSGDERARNHRDMEKRVKSSNGLKRSYQSSIENESVDTRNSGNDREMTTFNEHMPSQIRKTDFKKRSRDMRVLSKSDGQGDILNRDNVERPKPVSVTITSLSETRVPVVRSPDKDSMVHGECVVNGMLNGDDERKGVKTERPSLDAQNSETPAIPKWKQELQAKKRLQRERQGETSNRPKESIKPEQSGNDMAEWQKRLQGIRKTWGNEECGDPEKSSQGDHDVQKNTKDGAQDSETFV
ncbi:uncharacterized protein LOC114523642 isoform X2 [Dendronephthya gigantea]|uniref:uncharacterized protein LOC114523642 isoform X2 n=1 Tax=Dendronephthya gigantea TaxID=151771 RepID=UPI00106BFB37|nr:uncharacterized protein LOC114523642 isoform X2 [Dendronephthya gigantea]